MTKAEDQQTLVGDLEGVMALLQGLVVALSNQGALNTDAFAQLLRELRDKQMHSDRLHQAFVERMLAMVVGERATGAERSIEPAQPPLPVRGPN